MKKIISLILVLCVVISLLPVSVAASTENTELKQLPQVGTVISGFKTMEINSIDIINSKTALFKHEKTGAELLYIQNKDIDRSFDISFKTPAVNDTGVNHILEHISISGSKKYPLKNVMFSVANQTYSTFVNAMTSQAYTTYPLSSMSEAQLLKFTDMYLDCVFHPSVYDDKMIFSREAWRYEMADEKSPLTITGTVYNEMKGSLGDINTTAHLNLYKTLFPNSTQANVSGGDPQFIPDLTYDNLIKTHETYYHPSNSLMVLYGNLDYEKFLKLINDDYLSKYEKKDVKIDNGKVEPFKAMAIKTFAFPVSAKSNTKNAAEIDYGYVLNDISTTDINAIQMLVTLLNQPTSSLQKAFNQSKIGGGMGVSAADFTSQPTLVFTAVNADESRAADFKNLVDNEMKNYLKNGFDKESIDAIVSVYLLSVSNLTEAQNLGVNLSIEVGKDWALKGKTDSLSNITQIIKEVGTKAKDKYFEELIDKYILKNNHAALVTTVPQAGLAEKREAELQKKLADLKATMTKEQITKIIADTKAYTEWNSKADDQKIVDSIKVVNIADLPVEVKKYNINESKLSDGVKVLSAEAGVGEIAMTSINLDASGIPAEKLHYFKLYSNLLGTLDTKAYNMQQLNTQNIRYLNGMSIGVSTIERLDKSFNPYLSVSWKGIIGEYDKQIQLVKEILINTQFDNKAEILNIIKLLKSNLKTSFTSNPLTLLMNRNTSGFNVNSNYSTYINDLDYYNFLVKLEKTMEEKPDSVIAELKSINDTILNRSNMITAFSGNKDSIKKYESEIKTIIDALPAKAIAKQDYSKLPKPANKEGIVMDTAVQYNMVSATYEQMGTTFSGKYLPIAELIKEVYTTPKIRFGNGAYDNLTNFGSNGFLALSYRDPNIKETYDIYNGLADFIKNKELTQKELDSYILKTFGVYTRPSGELLGAYNAIFEYLSGKTTEEKLKLLNEIKSLTVEDVKASAKMFENLMKNGSYTTVGSSQKLNENKALFDEIIVAFDDGTPSNETLTRAQLMDILLAGAPNTLETAKQMGLITGDGKGNYRENAKVTREELAAILCKVTQLYGKQLGGKEVIIADIDKAGKWSKEAVKAAVYSGIMKLDSNGSFNPKGEVTAADVQAMVLELQAKLTAK